MPGYKTHIFGYLVMTGILLLSLYEFVAITFSIDVLLVGNLVGITYSIMPDMDTPSSKMRKILGRLFLAASFLCLLMFLLSKNTELIYIAIALNLFLYILWFSRHRGVFHTPAAGILLSIPLYLINPLYVAFAFLGFFSHLILDNEVFS